MRIPRLASVALLSCALLGFSRSAIQAQTKMPADMASMLSKIVLTTDLLDRIEKTAKAIVKATDEDSGFKAEKAAINKDRRVDEFMADGDATGATQYLQSKYPKVATVLTKSGMEPGNAVLTIAALTAASIAADMDWPTPDDKTVAANIAFAKANRIRIDGLFK